MDSWAWVHLVNRVLEVAPLLPAATAWLRRRHIPYKFKPIYHYVMVEAFFYFLDRLSRITVHNNIYIYHISTCFLVFFLTQAYSRILVDGRVKKAIPASLIVFGVVAVADAAFLNGLFTLVNSYAHSVGCTILLVLAIVHITHLTASPFSKLEKQPGFFLSVAVLVYCSSSTITYIATTIIYAPGHDPATAHRLDWIISVPDTFLFAVAMGIMAWMFSFFPLSIDPRRALPTWLHYSRWRQRPFRLLHQSLINQPFSPQLNASAEF